MLLTTFLALVATWRPVFARAASHRRAVRQALGGLLCLGRRTLSRIIWTNGGEQRSWSAEYFLHSRSPWNPQQLFDPLLRRALGFCHGRYIGVAGDDTRLRKTGIRIKQAFYTRDPLSPPFHPNLMLGLRFLQASLLVPLHRRANVATRALPIRFLHAPVVKRPGRRASAAQWQQFHADRKQHNLSRYLLTLLTDLRRALDTAGATSKILLMVLDGSFCNRTVFTAPLDRTHLLARTRKDAQLCFAAPPRSRRFYAVDRFTPEQVRQDNSHPWLVTKIFYGGRRRSIRYKDLGPLYWQGGARRRPLRLFVVAPTPYFKRQSGRRYYRQPAYLLTTDLLGPARILLQFYFDRWQIEINHREEKDTLGVGQAQLWNDISVPKQPVLAVAAYSALLLASLLAYGPGRGSAYPALPKWRRQSKRPSCLDLVALLRQQAAEHPELLRSLALQPSFAMLTSAAAA